MYYRVVGQRRRQQADQAAGSVRADGTIRLGKSDSDLIGVEPGDALELADTPGGLVLRPVDRRPQKVYVELTTGCNLDCAMCLRHSWEEPGGSMTRRTFTSVLSQLAAFACPPTINLSGFGEPMTHPRFFEFLTLGKRAGFAVELVTNGTFLDRAAVGRLLDMDLDRLVVSLDAVGGEADRLLHAGAFNDVKRNLRELKLLKVKRRTSRPEVAIEFVATKRNIGQLAAIRSLSLELGFAEIVVTNVVPYSPELVSETLYESWPTTPRRRPASPYTPCVDLPAMDTQAGLVQALDVQKMPGVVLHVNGREVAGSGPRCRFVTEGRLAVRWDGNVSPCLALMHTHTYYYRGLKKRVLCHHVGNVNDAQLHAIWEAPHYRAFRERVRRFDFSPCIDCASCDLRDSNEQDCYGDEFPRCGECLWAAGLVQCP